MFKIFKNKKAMCCKNFTLLVSYEEIKVDYEKYLKDPKSSNWYQIEKVYPMIIPLEQKPTVKNGFFYYHYTCKNLKDNKCTIHKTRPELCRAFDADDCKALYPKCQSNCFKKEKNNV